MTLPIHFDRCSFFFLSLVNTVRREWVADNPLAELSICAHAPIFGLRETSDIRWRISKKTVLPTAEMAKLGHISDLWDVPHNPLTMRAAHRPPKKRHTKTLKKDKTILYTSQDKLHDKSDFVLRAPHNLYLKHRLSRARTRVLNKY